MKMCSYSNIIVAFALVVITMQNVYSADIKWLNYGAYQAKVASTGDMGEEGLGWAQSGYLPFNGFQSFKYEGFPETIFSSHAWYLAARNWQDTSGTNWYVKMTGCGQQSSDELFTVMPVEDDMGMQIHKYVRYAPPVVTVDNFIVSEPFPIDQADYVDPGKLPGSAYAMIESWANTDMGVTLHQKVYCWDHDAHNNYLIYDWTFINTGNVDRDAEIELPNQTLDSLYFFRQERYGSGGGWSSAYGESPGDSLRIMYDYPLTSTADSHDPFGNPVYPGTGFLRRPVAAGCAILHVDRSPSDHSDWTAQPNMWAPANSEFPPFLLAPNRMSEANWILAFETMRDGYQNYPGWPMSDYAGQWENMHKSVRFDELGLLNATDYPYDWVDLVTNYAMGPYELGPGDSIRFVFALTYGSLSPEKAWEVGSAWAAGQADELWPEAEWPGGDYGLPDQFDSPQVANDANDLAKDAWVYSAVDSLFKNASSAQWSLQNGFDVPIPPAAPSLTVTSSPNLIKIEWGEESESYPGYEDFAGYRIYRAIGSPDPRVKDEVLIGTWELIFECGEGTLNDLAHSYEDRDAIRGVAYYYYVAAFDDGTANGPDYLNPTGGRSLESGKYLNRTTRPAFLTRSPGKTLADVRVIPNPFNLAARSLQFPGEDDKIMFYDIPPYCTINIYSESGDLVKTLEHDDGSGDQVWGIKEELTGSYSTTETGQLIVSGIYIAHIIVTQDHTDFDTGELLFKKGESTTVKFVVVR
jgi:hypothetical protein